MRMRIPEVYLRVVLNGASKTIGVETLPWPMVSEEKGGCFPTLQIAFSGSGRKSTSGAWELSLRDSSGSTLHATQYWRQCRSPEDSEKSTSFTNWHPIAGSGLPLLPDGRHEGQYACMLKVGIAVSDGGEPFLGPLWKLLLMDRN
jgi:hypothetical protein